MTEVKKWKVYLQKLLFIQIIYTFSRSIYIFQEFNQAKF